MRLNVSYACNDAYVEYTGVSMISLFENNNEFEKIYVYFIDMGLSDKSKNTITEISNYYNRKVQFIPFEELCSGLNVDSTGRHTKSVYAKLFFSRLQGVDKILYLDSDTIIASSLKELWLLDMESNLIAGVETISSEKKNALVGMNNEDKFINDGIVLINLKQWREEEIEPQFIKFIAEHKGKPPVLSEGTINGVCKGKIMILEPKYNLLSGIVYFSNKEIECISRREYYSQDLMNSAILKPVIIHYLSGFYNRPWCVGCKHPLKEYYYKYKAISPWKDTQLIVSPLPLRIRVINALHRVLPSNIFMTIHTIFGKK